MLNRPALDTLAKDLASVIASFGLPSLKLGMPDIVRKASEEAAQVFQGSAKALPSKADSYAAALEFLRGRALNERQQDLVASALSERIREQGNGRALGHRNLPGLLNTYAREADEGTLWRLTWFGLLGSYFAFDPQKAPEAESSGWSKLRMFLEQTWPAIDRQSGGKAVPDWVSVLRGDPRLVTVDAAHRYALEYLRGDDAAVKRLASDLAIPESSWFWHALVLSAVRRSAEQSDDRFKASIPKLLTLIESRPVYRDESLEIVLTRYHRCVDANVHQQLRDYVVRKDVWRNPKLRSAGLATSWNRVSDAVWQMVLQWVNKANLRDFFEVLAARRSADEGRLAFWSQYMEQISWTRLIFSAQTRWLAQTNEGIRNLIAREEGSYATMSANADVDAFMMQLGGYVIVEFSRIPNAAYVYKADELPFEPYDGDYTGTTADLKHGFRGKCAARFTHHHGWESDASYQLSRLGIQPDAKTTSARQSQDTGNRATVAATDRAITDGYGGGAGDRAPAGAAFTMASLRELVAGHAGVQIDDRREVSGGRLWVVDLRQRIGMGNELKRLGFKWANSREAWYYPEN